MLGLEPELLSALLLGWWGDWNSQGTLSWMSGLKEGNLRIYNSSFSMEMRGVEAGDRKEQHNYGNLEFRKQEKKISPRTDSELHLTNNKIKRTSLNQYLAKFHLHLHLVSGVCIQRINVLGCTQHKVGNKQLDGSWRKQGNSRKTSTSASLITLMPLTVWITTNCGKFLKRWEYQTTLSVSWETCMWVKKQQLESDMEQLTGSKLGKEYVKAVDCHQKL